MDTDLVEAVELEIEVIEAFVRNLQRNKDNAAKLGELSRSLIGRCLNVIELAAADTGRAAAKGGR